MTVVNWLLSKLRRKEKIKDFMDWDDHDWSEFWAGMITTGASFGLGSMVSSCRCGREIAVKWIRKVWYHVDTGREQCHFEDLLNIDVAQPA
ncbi:MAG: hypothetical protein EBS66_10805 [Betaproteobacteria bacterium]|nr:hypothetical protein [Betaproteobacteria bacterium]